MYFKDQLGFLNGQGKKIVFIDYSDSGVSLYSLKAYYDKFRSENLEMPEAEMHFIIAKNNLFTRDRLSKALGYTPKHTIIKGSLADNLFESQYDFFGINGHMNMDRIYDIYTDPLESNFGNKYEHSYKELVHSFIEQNKLPKPSISCRLVLSIQKVLSIKGN